MLKMMYTVNSVYYLMYFLMYAWPADNVKDMVDHFYKNVINKIALRKIE